MALGSIFLVAFNKCISSGISGSKVFSVPISVPMAPKRAALKRPAAAKAPIVKRQAAAAESHDLCVQ